MLVPCERACRRFLWYWLLLLFFATEGFLFLGYFFMPSALHPGFSGHEGFYQFSTRPWLDFVAYFCQTFPSLVCLILLRSLCFSVSFFYPEVFFILQFFPTFWRISGLWLRCEQEHRILDLPWPWTTDAVSITLVN